MPDHVIVRGFADESIALNLKTGQYHGLNQSAHAMLETLQRHGTSEHALDELSERFAAPRATLRRDLECLRADLCERGLLEPDVARDPLR